MPLHGGQHIESVASFLSCITCHRPAARTTSRRVLVKEVGFENGKLLASHIILWQVAHSAIFWLGAFSHLCCATSGNIDAAYGSTEALHVTAMALASCNDTFISWLGRHMIVAAGAGVIQDKMQANSMRTAVAAITHKRAHMMPWLRGCSLAISPALPAATVPCDQHDDGHVADKAHSNRS